MVMICIKCINKLPNTDILAATAACTGRANKQKYYKKKIYKKCHLKGNILVQYKGEKY